jgi:DNA-binding beta-propeller fold protein YncE
MPDRVMVFDKTGKKVFRSSDEAVSITVEGNKVYYFNKTTNTVCVGDLVESLQHK